MKINHLFTIAALISSASLLQAQSITFTDSFESPDVAGDGFSNTVPDGWVGSGDGYGSGNRGLVNNTTTGFNTPFGAQGAAARFATNAGFTTALTTDLGTLANGNVYTFSVFVASSTDATAADFTVGLFAFDDLDLRNDVRPTYTSTREVTKVSGSVDTTNFSQEVTFTYTADGTEGSLLGQKIGLVLRSDSTTPHVIFDNLTFEATIVPEPGAFALMSGCLALTSIMLRRRRRD